LIWRKKWSVVTVIFLITRYLPFADGGITLFGWYQRKHKSGHIIDIPIGEIAQHPNPGLCRILFSAQLCKRLSLLSVEQKGTLIGLYGTGIGVATGKFLIISIKYHCKKYC
jgi:hypothetical protein